MENKKPNEQETNRRINKKTKSEAYKNPGLKVGEGGGGRGGRGRGGGEGEGGGLRERQVLARRYVAEYFHPSFFREDGPNSVPYPQPLEDQGRRLTGKEPLSGSRGPSSSLFFVALG